MQSKIYKLNDELSITVKNDPTGEDLVAMKKIKFDPVFSPDTTAAALLECHYDNAKMLQFINILSEKPIEKLNKGVSGKVLSEAMQDFFLAFGIRFQS